MARHESDFRAAGEASLSPEELARLDAAGEEEKRHAAIALCLAGADGWQEALRLLGGTFAHRPAPATGLAKRKAE